MCNQCNVTPRAPIHQRKDKIFAAAVEMTRTYGYGAKGITRDAVAERAGVAAGLVNRYFGTMAGLMAEVMREAVEQQRLVVVAQGIAHGDHIALAAPAELRAAAVASLGGDL